MARTDLPPVVLISIGNTRTRITLADAGELEPSRVLESSDAAGVAAAAIEFSGDMSQAGRPAVLIASVSAAAAAEIERALRGAGFAGITRFGRGGDAGDEATAPVPIERSLDPSGEKTVGQDRLLDALGAFARSEQACVVIDAGTAITVDFVDGTGVFCGGAIAPGVQMMLASMHEGTAALPRVSIDPERLVGEPADDGTMKSAPFGKNTPDAMLLGAVSAARGLVRLLIDRYAEFYGAYPRVVATGGDAPLLFAKDPLVEAIVPDLTLVGMLAAYERLTALAGDPDAE